MLDGDLVAEWEKFYPRLSDNPSVGRQVKLRLGSPEKLGSAEKRMPWTSRATWKSPAVRP